VDSLFKYNVDIDNAVYIADNIENDRCPDSIFQLRTAMLIDCARQFHNAGIDFKVSGAVLAACFGGNLLSRLNTDMQAIILAIDVMAYNGNYSADMIASIIYCFVTAPLRSQ
jgi:hypothetical protein